MHVAASRSLGRMLVGSESRCGQAAVSHLETLEALTTSPWIESTWSGTAEAMAARSLRPSVPADLDLDDRLRRVIALFVTLDVRPTFRDQFLSAIESQSAASLSREPGCVHFDVCVDSTDPNRFLLYEIYEDEAAVEAHRVTPHFARWREAAERCVERQLITLAPILWSHHTPGGTISA